MRTSDWSNGYCPYLNVDITYSSQNGDTVYYDYKVSYCTTVGGAAITNGHNRDWNFKVDGALIISGSFDINGLRSKDVHSGSFSVSKGEGARDVTAEVSMFMDVEWNNVYGGWVSGSQTLSIPARTYNAHGNPSFSTSKATAHYGEVLKLSWDKSETQGNANFDHFELYQGNTQIYKGKDTNYEVTPSDVTGAKGGTVTYTLKEVHEWYGGYKTTETSITIKVQSGVVTIYDENRVKHVGLVTMYDEQRVKHYVLITAYDENGKAHNVV